MRPPSVVLVSGGARGLGLALVRELLTEGYAVATFSRQTTPEIEMLEREHVGRLLFHPGDVTKPDSLTALVDAVETELGPIDALINNAGIAVDGVLATTPPGKIQELVAINLTGTLLLTRLVVRRMLLRSRGSIVNVSSIIGIRGYSGLAAYGATKAAVDGMTRALARELGPRNIRVNSIAPGYLETDMSEALTESQRGQIIRRTPLGRLGRAEDVVGPVLFLLSPRSAFVTGITLTVDGGITC